MSDDKLSKLELAVQQKQAAQRKLRKIDNESNQLKEEKDSLDHAIKEIDAHVKRTP